MEMIRFCPECGHVGPVPPPALNCCPDGHHAQMVPWGIALLARLGFDSRLKIKRGLEHDVP
jgi:hypothetical protein